MVIPVREIIILSTIAIVKSQYDYYRPDIRANELGYNVFGEPFASNERLIGDEIPGKAGTDYPVFSEVPETGFRCDQQRYPGYYADSETGCQAFHICQRGGQSDSFLCPNGTIFNQEWLVCDWWYNFDCSRAENLYSVNEQVVRSMDEADGRLQSYRYNDLRRFGNTRANGPLDFSGFQNYQDQGFTPLNNQNILSTGSNVRYGVPGAAGFGRNAGRFNYNRGNSDSFERFTKRNGGRPNVFRTAGASGFRGASGYQRNLFRGEVPAIGRTYLPQGK